MQLMEEDDYLQALRNAVTEMDLDVAEPTSPAIKTTSMKISRDDGSSWADIKDAMLTMKKAADELGEVLSFSHQDPGHLHYTHADINATTRAYGKAVMYPEWGGTVEESAAQRLLTWIDEAVAHSPDPVQAVYRAQSSDFWNTVIPTKNAFEDLQRENKNLRFKQSLDEAKDRESVRISRDHAKVIKDLISLWRNCPYDDMFFFEQMERIVSSLETEDFKTGTGQMEAIVALRKISQEAM